VKKKKKKKKKKKIKKKKKKKKKKIWLHNSFVLGIFNLKKIYYT